MRTVNSNLSQYGRYGDTMMAHVAPGERIVPADVLDDNPDLAEAIAIAIKRAGADPDRYVVGSGNQSINPDTGSPEFFFKKVFKAIKKFAPVAAIAAPFLLPGVGAAVGGGLLGSASKVLGVVNGAKGLFGGGEEKSNGVTNIYNQQGQQEVAPAQAEAFTPSRPDAMSRPGSLSELSSFAPEQERSALATRGINQGLGSEEDAYYRNLLQRSLIGDSNQVQANNDQFLMPIESQYFSKRGQNTSDVMKFLQGIRG